MSRPGTLHNGPMPSKHNTSAARAFVADMPVLDGASCANPWVYPDDWFPTPGSEKSVTENAIAMCESCPVRLACLDYAIEHGERDGIWAGVRMDGNENKSDWLARVLKERRRIAHEAELNRMVAEGRQASREAWAEIRGGA